MNDKKIGLKDDELGEVSGGVKDEHMLISNTFDIDNGGLTTIAEVEDSFKFFNEDIQKKIRDTVINDLSQPRHGETRIGVNVYVDVLNSKDATVECVLLED